MTTLRIEPHLFAMLWNAFEAAAGDGRTPTDSGVMARVRAALADAAGSAVPGLPVILVVPSARELGALRDCFEVYSDTLDITDDQWEEIVALLKQAALA